MPHSQRVMRISPGAIQEARQRIRAEFLDSPILENHELSRAVGTRLLCKDETRNAVGSFKGRGTDSFIGSLAPQVSSLVTASAGNFGLALAYAAKPRGIPVTVFAAETASPMKLDRMRSTGAELKLAGRDFDESKDHARAAAKNTQAMFVEDGREPAITAGAGTIAMELTDFADQIDTIIVPLGNGALLAGIGCWLRSRSPRTGIVRGVRRGRARHGALLARSYRTEYEQC